MSENVALGSTTPLVEDMEQMFSAGNFRRSLKLAGRVLQQHHSSDIDITPPSILPEKKHHQQSVMAMSNPLSLSPEDTAGGSETTNKTKGRALWHVSLEERA